MTFVHSPMNVLFLLFLGAISKFVDSIVQIVSNIQIVISVCLFTFIQLNAALNTILQMSGTIEDDTVLLCYSLQCDKFHVKNKMYASINGKC